MKSVSFATLVMIFCGLGCGAKAPVEGVQPVKFDPIPNSPVVVPTGKPSVEPVPGVTPTATPSGSPAGTPTPPLSPAAEAAKNGKLNCEFEDECEPALALVSIAQSDGLSRCTGFLISDHEVLTNDHCLAAIPDRTDACQGAVFLHFSDNVHRECQRITVRSHQTGIASKDYAVIELNAPVTDRKPLKKSRRGFDNHEVSTIFSVQATRDPVTKTYDGLQVKRICSASYSTMLNINILSSRESLMTFGDCAIQEGNSGSPILNQNGEVGGVIQGFLAVKGDEFYNRLKPYLLDGSYGEVAIGTQLRCMPELNVNAANSCEAVKPLSALYPEDYLAGFGSFSEKILPKIASSAAWTELETGESYRKKFLSLPKCVSPSDAMRANFRFIAVAKTYRLGINSKMQAEWRLEDSVQSMFVSQGVMTGNSKTINMVSSEFGPIPLPICGR